jgi:alkanesulfonate monooxygenase SsuD/methylene tetrahydromethanopterin reductase-like flavin-dependent oxidoreductase (luciferase family)
MRFAVDIPNIGTFGGTGNDFADPHYVAELAHEAEESGWDGFFVWDHIGANWPVALSDPWVLMAAIAMQTAHIKLGPMVTPLPRRRPWKLARETITLDRLSNGRLILGVGIGGGGEYTAYDEPGDDRAHGAMLDEGLEILTGLWSGQPFSYSGTHYQVTDVQFMPQPVNGTIPIWVAGLWPNKAPFRRAARWDGMFPIGRGLPQTEQMTPEQIAESVAFTRAQRPAGRESAPFDVVHAGITMGADPGADREVAQAYAEAGVTWWLENFSNDRGTPEEQRARIRKGPPRFE